METVNANDLAIEMSGGNARIGDFIDFGGGDLFRCDGCDRPFAADARVAVDARDDGNCYCYCDACKVAA